MKLTTVEDATKVFEGMSHNQRVHCLALLVHWLTVYARGFAADPPCELALRRLQGVNELQHQISGHLRALTAGTGQYSSDVFWRQLFYLSDRFGMSESFPECVSSVFSRCLAPREE